MKIPATLSPLSARRNQPPPSCLQMVSQHMVYVGMRKTTAARALHGRAVAALVAGTPPRVLSPFVLAELDYLMASRGSHQPQMAPGESWSGTPTIGSA